MRTLLIAALVLAATAAGAAEERLAAGQEGQLAVDGKAPCMVYVPSDYSPGARVPLILFMHGSGGSPTTWPWKSATGGKGYLICGLSYGGVPDAGAKGIGSDAATVTAMVGFINKVRERLDQVYGIDQKRVFLTGLSMGGWGVNFYGMTKEARGLYRAYAILAAGARPDVDLTVAQGLPVLVLNGEQDPNLAAAKQGMPELEKAGALGEQVIIPGQGHVPAQNTTDGPLRDWLAKVEAAEARRRADEAIHWSDAAATGEPAKGADLGAWLAQQQFVKDAPADQPVMIFCRSTVDAAPGKASPQAIEAAAVEDTAFSYPGAVDVPLGSARFACYRIDASGIEAKTNRLLNAGSSPLVVLLTKERTVAATLKGKSRLTDATLWAEMKKLLDAAAAGDVDSRATAAAPTLKEMQALKKKLQAKEEQIAKFRAMPATDAATQKAKRDRIDSEQKALDELQSSYHELREKLKAAP
jgi:pimeloyl-ACP methyl ester carboxylesterase